MLLWPHVTTWKVHPQKGHPPLVYPSVRHTPPTRRCSPAVLTSCGSHRSGWYTSFWNAFVLRYILIWYSHLKEIKNTHRWDFKVVYYNIVVYLLSFDGLRAVKSVACIHMFNWKKNVKPMKVSIIIYVVSLGLLDWSWTIKYWSRDGFFQTY